MKKFVFELEQILEYRNFEKQQAEGELAQALAVENEINSQLQIIAQQYLEIKNQTKESVDFAFIYSQNRFKELLDFQKEELLNQLAKAKIVTEEKRKNLQECMKKTSALERMKEIQFEEYKEAAKMEEKKQLEELTAIKSFSELSKKKSN